MPDLVDPVDRAKRGMRISVIVTQTIEKIIVTGNLLSAS